MRVDLSNPLRTIAPTVEADVLAVLAKAHRPLSGRRVHVLAERSYSQVHAVLGRLVAHGLVQVEHQGAVGLYELNRTHVLAGPILDILNMADTVKMVIGDVAGGFEEPPNAVIVFGSLARGQGDEHSDIDLLLIRRDATDPESPAWRDDVDRLAAAVESHSGNPCQVLQLDEAGLTDADRRGDPLVDSLKRDGEVVFGVWPPLLVSTSNI